MGSLFKSTFPILYQSQILPREEKTTTQNNWRLRTNSIFPKGHDSTARKATDGTLFGWKMLPPGDRKDLALESDQDKTSVHAPSPPIPEEDGFTYLDLYAANENLPYLGFGRSLTIPRLQTMLDAVREVSDLSNIFLMSLISGWVEEDVEYVNTYAGTELRDHIMEDLLQERFQVYPEIVEAVMKYRDVWQPLRMRTCTLQKMHVLVAVKSVALGTATRDMLMTLVGVSYAGTA